MSEMNDKDVKIANDVGPDVSGDVIETKPVEDRDRELYSKSKESLLSADAADFDATISSPSGKEYIETALLHNVDVDEFLSLGGIPRFDIKALKV